MDTDAEVSVCIKSMVDLLKLKLKADKIMIVLAIDKVKQKSLESAEIIIIKVIN